MQITDVRIKLMNEQERLLAFCSVVLDGCFVIRDLKIIRGARGLFVAMPSRKLTDKCSMCGMKNELRSNFCGECGRRLPANRALRGTDGRSKLFADVAHPINAECRDMIQVNVVAAYEQELLLARQPNYTCRYEELGGFHDEDLSRWEESESHHEGSRRFDPPAPAVRPHDPTSLPQPRAPGFDEGVHS